MAQLVLLVLAGVAGLIGYNEAAKIEKRFRRGPMGLPSPVWGVASLVLAALLGVLLGAEVVVGLLIGFAGYSEAVKVEKRDGGPPLGVPPIATGIACSALGLIGTIVSATFVVWAVVGFVAYTEAARYEGQFDKRALRIPAAVWGVVFFFLGLAGAFLVSPLVCGTVCAFLGLVGAFLLLLAERGELIAEKNALIDERNALLAAANPARQASAPPSAAAEPLAPAARPQQQPAPQPQRWPLAPGAPSTQPVAPRPSAGNGSDFLPTRR